MKARLANEPARSAAWVTASTYQLAHALAAALAALPVGPAGGGNGGGAIAAAAAAGRRVLAPRASAALTAGSVLFSTSLYAYAATGERGVAAGAPVGGVVMVGGWLALAAGV